MYMLSSLFHRAMDRAVCCISAGPISQVIVLRCNALARSNMILIVPTKIFMGYKRILYSLALDQWNVNGMYSDLVFGYDCCSMIVL